jgi:hypothetical protein
MADDYTLADYRIDLYRLRQMGGEPCAVAGLGTGVYDGLLFEDWPRVGVCLERLLDTMTPGERKYPNCIDSVAIERLADLTGMTSEEVERAIEHFRRVPDAMRRLAQMSMWERIKVLCGC